MPPPPRSRWATLAPALAGAATLATIAFIAFRPPATPPPDIDSAGLDPAIAQVIRDAAEVVRRDPHSSHAWGQLGATLMHYEFATETSAAFAEASRLAPNDGRWSHLHGLALGTRDLPEALSHFRRAAGNTHVTNDAPRLRLAEALAELGADEQAAAEFQTLLKHQPRHAPATLGLARLAIKQQHFAAATNLLLASLHDPHTRRAAHSLLAAASQSLGNTAAARTFAATAATLPPDAAWPDPWWTASLRYRVGRRVLIGDASTLLDQGKLIEAMALLTRVTKDYPEDAEGWYLAGWTMLQQQRATDAERALRQYLRISPQSPKGHAQLGVALLMQRRFEDATAVLQAGAALKPTWREFQSNLGFAAVQLGRTDQALAHYREALNLDPTHVPTHTSLAELFARRGDYAEARRLLQQAIELAPNDTRIRAQLDRLPAAGSG